MKTKLLTSSATAIRRRLNGIAIDRRASVFPNAGARRPNVGQEHRQTEMQLMAQHVDTAKSFSTFYMTRTIFIVLSQPDESIGLPPQRPRQDSTIFAIELEGQSRNETFVIPDEWPLSNRRVFLASVTKSPRNPS